MDCACQKVLAVFDSCDKDIPVISDRGQQGEFPHFLYNRLKGRGGVVSLTLWPPITPKKIPGTHFF
jgi:hypothetical protein